MSRMRNPYLADSDTDEEKDTVPGELNTPRYPGSKNPERGTGIYTNKINESGFYDSPDGLFRLDSGYPRESGIYTKRIDGSMNQGRPSGVYPGESALSGMDRQTNGADNQRVLPDYSLTGNGHPPVTNGDGGNYRDNTSVEGFCDKSEVRSPNDTLPWIRTATSHEFINEYEFTKIAFANHKGSFRSAHSRAPFSNRAETPDITTETSRGSSIDKKPKCFIATLAALLLFLVVAAAIAIPLIVYMYDRNRVSDEYAEVTVNVTFNNTYLPEYNNKSSAEYQTLTTNICNSMTDVYKYKDSKYSDQYRGCRIDSVTPGSVVVTVVFYFIQTKVVDNPEIVGILVQNSVSVYQTTGLVVIQNTVTVITQSTVSSVPSDAIIVTTSTTMSTQATTGAVLNESTTERTTTELNTVTTTNIAETTTTTETTNTTAPTAITTSAGTTADTKTTIAETNTATNAKTTTPIASTETETISTEGQTTTEPNITTTETITTSTEPGTTSTASGTTSTQPGTTSTAPGTTSTEPETTSTATGTTSSATGTTSTEPGTISTAPGTTSTQPGTTSTAPGTTSTEPATTPTTTGTTSKQPGTTSTATGTTSTAPGTTSTEPATTPTTTGTTSKQPETTSTATGTTSSATGTTSTQPGTTSTAPGTTSKQPGTTSTAPGTTSTEPETTSTSTGTTSSATGTTSTEPGTISTAPGTTSTQPGTTSTAPGTTSTEPATTPTATGTTSKEPGTTSTAPGTTSTQPGTTSTAPGTTSTQPNTTSTTPVTTSTEPTTTPTATGTTSTEHGTTPTAPGTTSTEPGTSSTAPGTTSTTTGTTSTDPGTTSTVPGTTTEGSTTTEPNATTETDNIVVTPVVIMNDVTAVPGSDVTLACSIYNAKNWTLVRILKKDGISGLSEILTWKPNEAVNIVSNVLQIGSTSLSSSISENFTVSVTFNSSSVCRAEGSYRCEVTSYGEIKNISDNIVVFKTTPVVDISVKDKYGQYVQSEESCTLQTSEDNQDFGLYIQLPNEATYQRYTAGLTYVDRLQTKTGVKDNDTCLTNVTLTFVITAKHPEMDGAKFICNGTTSKGINFTSNVATISVTSTEVSMASIVRKDGEETALTCRIQNPANWTSVKLIDVSGPNPNSILMNAAEGTTPTISSGYIYDSNITSNMNGDLVLVAHFNSSSVCTLEGEYRCVVELHGTEISSAKAKIIATANPSSMQISVTSSYSQNIPSVEYCSVVTAETVSDFSVYIKKNGESGFTKISDQSISIISGIEKTSDFRVNETCSQNTNLTFTLTPTYPGMNGAEIKCEGTTVKGNQFTTSVQTITVNPAGVAFLDPTVLKYLDDGGSASMTCAVRNIPNWNNIVIKRIPKGSVTPEVVANVTQSDENLVSNIVPRVQLTAQKVTNISVKLEFTSVECTDEGQYICEVTNDADNVTAKDTMDFVLYRRPTLPELSLHIDQVENIDRLGSEHKCFGNTGYPPGVMKLEYLTTNMENFKALAEPISILRMLPNETGIGACESNKTYKFGLQMPQEWNQAIIRCSIENPLVLGDTGPLAINDTIELILSSTCNGTVGEVYKSNFYNCSRFTQCLNGVPYILECPAGLLFGILKSTRKLGTNCDHPYNVDCEKDITTTTTTTTTMAPNNDDIQCTDRYTFIGNAQIIIDCNVSISANQNLTVSRGDQRLAFVDGAGTVTNDGVADISVTFDINDTPKHLQIRISNVKCRDEGVYTVTPSNGLSTRATLKVKEKPKGSPTLAVPLEIVEDELWHAITCSGDVGYPKGRLKFEIKMPDNDTFQEVKANSSSYQEGNCRYNSDISLSLIRGMDMHGSVIRCSTENNETFEAGDPDVRSTEKILSVIPKSVCENATGEVKYHPYDCNKYITCLQGNTVVQSCQHTLYWHNQQCVTTTDHCPPNTVLTTTTMAPKTTQKPPVIMMNDVTAKQSKEFELKCSVYNADQWTAVKVNGQINGEQTILTLAPDGSHSIQTNSYTPFVINVTKDISSENATVSVFFLSNDVCKLEGKYKCVVERGSGSYFKEANVFSTVDPVFTSFPFGSAYEENIQSTESCTFNVSNDNVDVGLYLRSPGATAFTKSDWSITITKGQRDPSTCMLQLTLSFNLQPNVAMNGTEFKCIASNQDGNVSSEIRTLFVTLAGITFQDLEVSGFIDTDSVITTCILRNMGGWSTISISKEGTAIFTINAGSTTDSNLDTRIKQAVSDDGTEMRISLNFTSILCSDEGIYTCSVQKASVIYNATMKMSAKQMPDTPVLVLSPTQVENTSSPSYEHKCDGYVGYPGGGLVLKIRKNGETTFQNLAGSNMLIIRSRKPSKGNCSNYETLKFGLKLTMDWDQAEIVCLSDNPAISPSNTQPPSANATIELIPGTFCDGKSNGLYRHPYNCSRYVNCFLGVPSVTPCSVNTCFDESKGLCDHCHAVVCEVTTTAVPTTPAQSSDISCVGASAYIGDTAALSCILNATSFHNISVTRLTSGTNQIIANIQGDGSVQHQGIQNIQVTFNTVGQPKEIVINITNVVCNDDGLYTVNLDQQAQATASLIVKNKITTRPSLELGVDIMENELTDDIICRGNLGNPKGELRFEMKLQGESNFTVITGVTPTLAESTGNCDTQQNATIKITAQMSMNNSLVRCNMINSNTGQTGSNALVSNEVPFLVIPQSVCTGEDGNRTYHPYECNKYVWCLLSNRVVQKCSASNLCFDKTIGNCQTACSQCPPNSVVPSP